jgi:acetyltransferase-like isoleucine patch superfamily enzyme
MMQTRLDAFRSFSVNLRAFNHFSRISNFLGNGMKLISLNFMIPKLIQKTAHHSVKYILCPMDQFRNDVALWVKKSTIGKDSKISHLSYVGDTVMGAGVNIGAGVITCNYDGVNKHQTQIGDGAFIGSDTQLIAPVTIGKNATIGAGSTITKDVPDGQLSLSRAKQAVLKNWMVDFFTSTKLPILALSPILVSGRMRANGPIDAPLPMTASSITELCRCDYL